MIDQVEPQRSSTMHTYYIPFRARESSGKLNPALMDGHINSYILYYKYYWNVEDSLTFSFI